jgi:hypothetical protein
MDATPDSGVAPSAPGSRGFATEPQASRPSRASIPNALKRGETGRCVRRSCECEENGLGDECIWLTPMAALQREAQERGQYADDRARDQVRSTTTEGRGPEGAEPGGDSHAPKDSQDSHD